MSRRPLRLLRRGQHHDRLAGATASPARCSTTTARSLSATDAVTTALGAALSSPTLGTTAAQRRPTWNGPPRQARSALTTRQACGRNQPLSRIGAVSHQDDRHTSTQLNPYVASITVYNTARAPVVASSVPITTYGCGTIATLSSGALQGAAPSTYVNGNSWSPTVNPAVKRMEPL